MNIDPTVVLPRVCIYTNIDAIDHYDGKGMVSVPTMRKTTAEFAALIGGAIAVYTFEAVGPVTLQRSTGTLSEEDRKTLRQTRRLINELLDE